MRQLHLDLRATLRTLRRSPGLVILAVAALAMGIGFTTTMFSIVRGGTRPLPFPDADDLLVVTRTLPRLGLPDLGATAFDYRQWSVQQTGFMGLAAFSTSAFNLSGQGERPERIPGAVVTAGTFELLGQPPALGRSFGDDDARAGAPAVVVIGHDLWKRRFEGRRDVLGTTLRIDGRPYTIVGVMPEGFGFPVNASAWVPLEVTGAEMPVDGGNLQVFGRLRPGVTLARAQTEFGAVAARLAERFPDSHADLGIRLYPFVETEMPRELARVMFLMVAATSFVLFIACANVANLLLARAVLRTRDVAIRTALGASRTRIVLQQLGESLLLASVGALLGIAIAGVAVRFFDRATAHIIEAFWMEFRVDGLSLLFATGLTGLAAVAAGIMPGWRASRADPGEALKDQAHGSSTQRIGRVSGFLVAGEVALSCGLLVMTLILVQTALDLRAVAMPFDARAIFTAEIGLPQHVLADRAARNRLHAELIQAVGDLPGVASAALAGMLPGRGSGSWAFELEDEPAADAASRPKTQVAAVTPGFLDVLGGRILRGRDINALDTEDAPGVALANQSFAARFSPDADVLGRRIRVGNASYTIVGLVPDLQVQDVEDTRGDGLYLPLAQTGVFTTRVLAATHAEPLALAQPVLAAVERVAPDLPVYGIMTLHDAIYEDKRVLDALGTLFFLFGLGALFLTVVGLYGVVSFGVAQRTREIGIRRALGAHPYAVVMLVLRGGMRWVGAGLVAGLAIAFVLSRAFVAGVEAARPAGVLTFTLVTGSLVLTSLCALIVPSRRALGVDPTRALRND